MSTYSQISVSEAVVGVYVAYDDTNDIGHIYPYLMGFKDILGVNHMVSPAFPGATSITSLVMFVDIGKMSFMSIGGSSSGASVPVTTEKITIKDHNGVVYTFYHQWQYSSAPLNVSVTATGTGTWFTKIAIDATQGGPVFTQVLSSSTLVNLTCPVEQKGFGGVLVAYDEVNDPSHLDPYFAGLRSNVWNMAQEKTDYLVSPMFDAVKNSTPQYMCFHANPLVNTLLIVGNAAVGVSANRIGVTFTSGQCISMRHAWCFTTPTLYQRAKTTGLNSFISSLMINATSDGPVFSDVASLGASSHFGPSRNGWIQHYYFFHSSQVTTDVDNGGPSKWVVTDTNISQSWGHVSAESITGLIQITNTHVTQECTELRFKMLGGYPTVSTTIPLFCVNAGVESIGYARSENTNLIFRLLNGQKWKVTTPGVNCTSVYCNGVSKIDTVRV